MSENYEMKIDPSGAESGAVRIEKSFKKIADAADKMEGRVVSAFEAASKVLRTFNSIGAMPSGLARDVRNLSASLSGFKGPSQAAVKSTLELLSGLKRIGTFNVARGSSVAQLLTPLSNYKGPSASSARNTSLLLRALSGFTGGPAIGRGLSQFMSALGSYRGPTEVQTRNTRAFLTALSKFTPPQGVNTSIQQFRKLAEEIDKAARSLRTINAGSRTGNLRFPAPSKDDISRLRDYAHQHGALQTAVLRTQTAFHALGGVLGAKFIIDASNQVVRIRAQLEAATGSVAQANVQFEFLRDQTEKLGLEFTQTAKTFGLLLASTKGVNISFAETQEIFKGFATASRALQLSADDVGGVFRALGQILSKGKLQAEELRGQLGDRLPGAFVRFAAALDLTKPGELDNALKKGAISGDRLKNAILEVARTLESDYAEAAKKASNTVDSAFNRLRNAFTFESAELGANGLNAALISLFDSTRKLIQSDAFSTFLYGLATVFKILGDNIEVVATLIGSGLIAKFVLATATVARTTTIFATFATVLKGIGFAAVAAGMGNVRAAAIALFTVIRAHPFVFLATAIAAVVTALTFLKKATDETTRATNEQAGASAYAANLAAFYANKIDQGTSSINVQTQALRQNTIEKIRNAAAGTGITGDDLPFKSVQAAGSRFATIGGKRVRQTNDGYTYNIDTANGYRQLYGGNARIVDEAIAAGRNIKTPQQYKTFIDKTGYLGALIASNPELESSERLRSLYNDNIRRVTTLGSVGSNPAYRKVYEESVRQVSGPDNTPLITGDVEPKGGGGKKGGGGQSQYQNALDRMIQSLKDLKVEAGNAQAAVSQLLAGRSTQDVEAAQAAADAIQQMRGSFDTQAEFEKAVTATAAALGLQAKGFDEAKSALQSYYKEQELAKKQAEVDAGVLGRIEDLRTENKLRQGLVESAMEGAEALSRAETLLEYEKELTNGTAENREAILAKAKTELKIQEQINNALDAAKRLSDYRIQGEQLKSYQGLYGAGYNSDELEEAKKLLDLRGELERKGYSTEMAQGILNAEKATFRLIQADKKLQEEFEKNIEFGQDMSDAIVDGFASAISGGKSFLDSMKDIFKNLKNIILEFVLYNPLREWLREVLTPKSVGSGAQAQAVRAGANAFSSFGDAASTVSNLFSSSVGPTSLGATAAGLSIQNGNRGYLKDAFSDAIVVTAQKTARTQADATLEAQKRGGFFEPLKRIFDYKNNPIGDGSLKKVGDTIFSSNTKLGDKMKALGEGIGKVAQVAASAFAAYELGSSVAGALGLGKVGKGIFGGAAAGYSVGGPIGAAIGAVIGGVAGALKKTPSAYAKITKTEDGQLGISASGKRGKGDLVGAKNLATGGISLFEDFSDQFGASLSAGDYGTFGVRKKKTFYSTIGTSKKGKPLGREGVDYIYGDDSQLQAFALRKQIQAGKFAGLDPIYTTIANNSKSSTIDAFNDDLNIGKAYLDFIDQAIPKSDIQKNISNLQKSFDLLSAKSKSLGLDTNKLTRAYELMKKTIKEDFNYSINQELLGFSDPIMAEWNDLVKEYEQTVADGVAAGGDLLKVEELFGKKRQALIEQFLEQGVNAVKNAGKDLLYSLTATSSSPLSAGTVFNNAQSAYTGLVGEFAAGNYTNADKLNEIVSSYLDAARSIFGSNSQFFDIFNQVTGFLGSDLSYGSGSGSGAGGTPANDLPELPTLQSVLSKLEDQKNALVESNNSVGTAILEGNAQITELLAQLVAQGLIAGGSLGSGEPLNTQNYYNTFRFGNSLL